MSPNPQMMWSSSSGRDFQGTSSPNGPAIRTTPNGLPDARTLIVSNRLPITVRVDGDETRIESSVGGLATGLRRVPERNGQCDTVYLRCVRACDAPVHGGTDSVVLRRRQDAGGAGAPKP